MEKNQGDQLDYIVLSQTGAVIGKLDEQRRGSSWPAFLSLIARLWCMCTLIHIAELFIQQLNPMCDRQLRAAPYMHEAADIGCRYPLGSARLQCCYFIFEQLLGQLRLQNRVGTSRSTAEMRVWHICQLEACRGQNFFHHAPNPQTMLQGAGRMKGKLIPFFSLGKLLK